MLGVNKYTGEYKFGEFYNSASKTFHEAAAKRGLAEDGMFYVPDLAGYARDHCMDLLNSADVMTVYGSDEEGYYRYVLDEAFCAGVAYGHQWHEDFTRVEHGDFREKMEENGAIDMAEKALEEAGAGTDGAEKIRAFRDDLYTTWNDIMKDSWDGTDVRDRIFDIVMAVFQTGVSVVLRLENAGPAVRE
ncbi:MAG: hypothetical protein ACI4LM_01435 [Anaerovoracaceae bacterium]